MHGALTACKNLSLKYNCTRSSRIPPLMVSRRYTTRFAALTASMFATLACSADFARAHSRILPWGDPPVGAVDVSERPAPDPEAPPPATVANWRCISLSTCPEGVYVLTGTGDHYGCEAGNTCSGNCITCAGSVGPYKLCQAHSGSDCQVPGNYRSIFCGLARSHANACSPNQPSGVPQTPNGCYCNSSAGFTNLMVQCELAECQ